MPDARSTTLKALAGVAVGLLALDLLASVIDVPPPLIPGRPRKWSYFDYGLSVEAKLRRMVQPDESRDAPVVAAGWLEDSVAEPFDPPTTSTLTVTIYGQSFSNRAAVWMVEDDPEIYARLISGPGGPPSYVYSVYARDPLATRADLAVLSFVSSTVNLDDSMSGVSFMFENPAPYTFPRYRVVGDGLEVIEPVLPSRASLREALLAGGDDWRRHVAQLAEHDSLHDSFIFDAGPLDRSALVRMVRRAYANRLIQEDRSAIVRSDGSFDPDAEAVMIMRKLVLEVGRVSKARGQPALLLLVNTVRTGDRLENALRPELDATGLPYLSTNEVASPSAPNHFNPDGHFRTEIDRAIGARLGAKLREMAGR